MTRQPLVSFIIASFNYACYLGRAIDSALAQTYPLVEVIVVDDGSSDDSPAVIRSYGDRIVPILKDNGGQASALNAGLAVCRGEIVHFLDADDVLRPDIVEQVVAAVAAHPDAALVQYRVAVIDAEGRPTGALIPPASAPLRSGDLRQHIVRCGSYHYPPTSANAATVRALRRIGPIPEATFRISPDYFLAMALPLVGPVVGLDVVGADYRIHGANVYGKTAFNAEKWHHITQTAVTGWPWIKRVADALGIAGFPAHATDPLDLRLLTARMISAKVDPPGHPIPHDRPALIAARGVAMTWRAPETPLRSKAVEIAWLMAMAVVPRRWAAGLSEAFLTPGKWRRVSRHLMPVRLASTRRRA